MKWRRLVIKFCEGFGAALGWLTVVAFTYLLYRVFLS